MLVCQNICINLWLVACFRRWEPLILMTHSGRQKACSMLTLDGSVIRLLKSSLKRNFRNTRILRYTYLLYIFKKWFHRRMWDFKSLFWELRIVNFKLQFQHRLFYPSPQGLNHYIIGHRFSAFWLRSKCSICSYQLNIWYEDQVFSSILNWFLNGDGIIVLAQIPSRVNHELQYLMD
jgi:hypothetical protein